MTGDHREPGGLVVFTWDPLTHSHCHTAYHIATYYHKYWLSVTQGTGLSNLKYFFKVTSDLYKSLFVSLDVYNYSEQWEKYYKINLKSFFFFLILTFALNTHLITCSFIYLLFYLPIYPIPFSLRQLFCDTVKACNQLFNNCRYISWLCIIFIKHRLWTWLITSVMFTQTVHITCQM